MNKYGVVEKVAEEIRGKLNGRGLFE